MDLASNRTHAPRLSSLNRQHPNSNHPRHPRRRRIRVLGQLTHLQTLQTKGTLMTTKQVYLDVDGVIGPYDPIQKTDGWHYRTIRAAGMSITYSPNLIAALLNLPAEIVWLTSWENHAAEELAPTIGLPHYRVLHPTPQHDGSETGTHWWKLNALQADKPTNFYWIDDELASNMSARHWTERAGGNWISPNRFTGVTPTHIQQLKEWATK